MVHAPSYQLATFAQHPASSLIWLGSIGMLLVGVFLALRLWADREESAPLPGRAARAGAGA